MTPEASEAMRTFARNTLSGRLMSTALQVFVDTVYTDPDVADYVDEWLGEIVNEQARALLYSVQAEDRVAGPAGGRDDYVDRTAKPLPVSMLARWGASVAEGYGFIMPDGKRLGDCTRAEIVKAADRFETMSKESAQKARWMRLIAQGMPEGETVRKRFKPSRLTELAIEAEKSERLEAAA